jgi:Na+/melibiose symporter-like transporter
MKNITGDSNTTSQKALTPFDYIKITIFGLGIGALWNSLDSIVLQIRLLDLVTESQKNTYLGLLTFSGLILAILVQPIIGRLSDRSNFRWGRRRPYILIGTLAALPLIMGLGLATSFAAIFAIYLLLQISTNTAQGPYQALVPDLVPEGQRGQASGWKSVLEIGGSVAIVLLVGQLMGRYYSGEGDFLLLTLGVLAIVLLAAMLANVLAVKERPGSGNTNFPSLSNLTGTLKNNFRTSIIPTLRQTFTIDLKENPDFIYFLLSRSLFIMTFITFRTFSLYLLRDVVGVTDPAAETSKIVGITALCMVAIVYPAGRLSDRIGRKPVLLLSGILAITSIIVIYLLRENYDQLIIGVIILGISFGLFWSSNWALATDLVGKGEEARFLGLTNLATAGGSALARLIGPVIDYFNAQRPELGYEVMLLACLIYLIIGTVLITRIKGKH